MLFCSVNKVSYYYSLFNSSASSAEFSAAFKDLCAMNTTVMAEYTKALLSSMRRFFNDFNDVFTSVPVDYVIATDSVGLVSHKQENVQVEEKIFRRLILI